jgi:glyoxylase-like metal-dependent hydrolase (beta-lactamase superfamily II)
MLRASRFESVTRFDLGRTIAGRGLYWTTAYLVDGMLIDTGCAYSSGELVRYLEGKDVSRIFNTHSHEDHIGANGRLQRERGLEILAHPLALPVLADPHAMQPLHPYRKLFWGWPEPSQANPVQDEAWVETAHHRFQVLFTPGHAVDHYCLYEPDQGWLFTGDIFVGGRERALRDGYDIWQIIDSLERVCALPSRVMFPGSARIRTDPREELASKIAYLRDFGGRVLDLHHKGWDVDSIVKALCGKPMFIEAVTLGNFTRRHLVLSYLKHHQA